MPDVQPDQQTPLYSQPPQNPQVDNSPTPEAPSMQDVLAGSPQSTPPDVSNAGPQPNTAPNFSPTPGGRLKGMLLGALLGGAPGALAGVVDPRIPTRAVQQEQQATEDTHQMRQANVKFQTVQAAKMQADLHAQEMANEVLPETIQQERTAASLDILQKMQNLGVQPTLITDHDPADHQAGLEHLTQTRDGVPPMSYLHVGDKLVGFDLNQLVNGQDGKAFNLVRQMAPLMALPDMTSGDFQKLPKEKQIDLANQALTFWTPTADPQNYRQQIANYRSLKQTYMAAHPDDDATAAKFDKTIRYLQDAGSHYFFEDANRQFVMSQMRQQAALNEAMADTSDGSIASQLVEGTLDPSQLSKRGKDYSVLLKSANEYSLQHYGKAFDAAKAQADYKFATNPQTQNTLKYLNSLTGADNKGGNLQAVVDLSNNITRSRFPSLNDAAGWARIQTGDRAMAEYHTAVTEVADQIAKILQGGGSGGTSDAKMKQASDLFKQGFTKDQINGVASTLRDLLTNRKTELIGDNRYLQRQFGKPAAQATTSKGTTSNGNSGGATHVYDPNTGTVKPIAGTSPAGGQ